MTGKWHQDKASFAKSFDTAARIFFGGMSNHEAVPVHDFDPTGEYPEAAKYTAEGFSTELFADAAVQFLERHDGETPFFLYLAFTAPHDPRTPPKEYAELYDPERLPLPPNAMPEHPFDNGDMRRRDEQLAPWPRTPDIVRRHTADYYGMITHLDAQLGRVLEALERRGWSDNTLIVYTADHGLAVGRHGLLGKANMYEHSLRIPLIVCGPGVPEGRRIDGLACQMDLFPTVCGLAGIECPEDVEGESLVPLICGDRAGGRQSVFALYKDLMRMVRDGQWKLVRYYRSELQTAGSDWIQLFDLKEDPHELNDVSGQFENRHHLKRLAAEMSRWQSAVQDPWARPIL